jgi:hypothetical protein
MNSQLREGASQNGLRDEDKSSLIQEVVKVSSQEEVALIVNMVDILSMVAVSLHSVGIKLSPSREGDNMRHFYGIEVPRNAA